MCTHWFLLNFILISLRPTTEALKNEAITSGKEAPAGQYLFAVGVHVEPSKFCSGVVISEKHVLTAAQCVAKTGAITATSATVIAGINKLRDQQSTRAYHSVEEVFIRLTFNLESHEHDIAILKLLKPLSFAQGSNIGKISLARTEDVYLQGTVYVFGFDMSLVKLGSPNMPGRLGFAITKIMSTTDCQKFYKTKKLLMVKNNPTITADMLCAQIRIDRTPETSVCRNDIGGPLVMMNRDGLVLIGLLSVTDINAKCAGSNAPSIYTKITGHLDFVNKVKENIYNPRLQILKKLYVNFEPNIKVITQWLRELTNFETQYL